MAGSNDLQWDIADAEEWRSKVSELLLALWDQLPSAIEVSTDEELVRGKVKLGKLLRHKFSPHRGKDYSWCDTCNLSITEHEFWFE